MILEARLSFTVLASGLLGGSDRLWLFVILLLVSFDINIFLVIRKTSVLGKGSNLGLEEDHVFGERLHRVSSSLLGLHTVDALFLSSLVLAVVSSVDNSQEEENNDDGSQSGQTLRVLGEEEGNTQKNQRNKEEAHKDVNNGKSLPEASSLSKLASSVKRYLSHEGDGVPDEDTKDVEEKVSQGDLERGDTRSDQRSHHGSHGGTNVGTKRQGEHLFQSQSTNSDKGSKSGGSDGRRLDKHGNTDSHEDGEVSVDVGSLVDDTGRSSQKHLLKNVDKSEKAEEENSNGDGKDDKSRNLIFMAIGSGLEEGRALVGILVAANQTDVASAGGGVVVVIAANNVIVVRARSTLGNILDNILVSDNDQFSKRGNNLLDGALPLFSFVSLEVSDACSSEVFEHTRSALKGEEDSNSQKVEHVMDSGSSESTFELVSISQVTHGNDCVGNGSTDVGSHNHVDTLASRDGFSSDKRDDDRGGSRRRLKEDSGEDTNHETGNRVGFVSEKLSSGTSSHDLGTSSEKFQSEKEKVEEEADSEESYKDPAPFFGTVDAAGLAHFLPGSISDIVNVLFALKVDISDVHRSSWTVLAVLGGGVSDNMRTVVLLAIEL
jgi:hypothetical protein